MKEWEARLPHLIEEVEKRGNSMTQAYYIEKILPNYVEQIQKHRKDCGETTVQQR